MIAISVLTFIYQVADAVIMILEFAIIIRALLSWFPQLPNHPIIRILYDVTDPLLRPFQRFQIGGGGFGIDFSPIVAYIVLRIIRSMVLPFIFDMLGRVIL